jgi:hypothetical protein
LGSIYAAGFHLIRGKRIWKLPLFWLASLLGFAVGHLAGVLLGWDLALIGETHVVEGTLISWLLLLFADWMRV